MRSEQEIHRVIDKYGDMIRRICFLHLKNYQDTEDIFQDVFLKYLLWDGSFESDAHEKSWFARVTINACRDLLRSFTRHTTINACRDLLRSFTRHTTVSLEEIATVSELPQDPDHQELLQQICSLPPKYRDVIYLFYYEGYSAVEIAKILHKKENTIYTWLDRARKALRKQLGGENHE